MTKYKIYNSEAEVRPAAPNLWSVSNCFDEHTFNWLSNMYLDHDEIWHRHRDCLEYRLQIAPDSKSFDSMTRLCNDMTGRMEEIVGLSLAPAESKVWLDLPYFHCPYHPDAELLVVTYQVYLWSYGGHVPGTTFCHTEPPTTVPFLPNTGYINLNKDLKVHHVDRTEGVRLSCCFQWRAKV